MKVKKNWWALVDDLRTFHHTDLAAPLAYHSPARSAVLNLRLLLSAAEYGRILLVQIGCNSRYNSMAHKRSVKEQVKSGFLIAGELVGGFSFSFLLRWAFSV